MQPDRYMCLAARGTINAITKLRSAEHDNFATPNCLVMARVTPCGRVHLGFNFSLLTNITPLVQSFSNQSYPRTNEFYATRFNVRVDPMLIIIGDIFNPVT